MVEKINENRAMDNGSSLAKQVADIILRQANQKERFLVAIDGRCASGKTTLAMKLKEMLDCEVVHMDHFFLRPEQRREERLNIPGENVDHERFLQEVLLPLYEGKEAVYRPFNCKCLEFDAPIRIRKCKIYIIEGSYSCHRALGVYYNLRIFMDVSSEEQMRRIVRRNGADAAEVFRSKWIPLEEGYFEKYNIADASDYCFTT